MERIRFGAQIGILSVVLAAAATEARAGTLPAAADNETASRAQGLGRAQVVLLSYSPGPGNDVIASRLKASLGLNDAGAETEARGGTNKVFGAGWKLTVSAGGTFARFRRQVAIDDKGDVDGLLPADLVSLGYAAISQLLGDIVVLGPGEEIVPLHTRYQRLGGQYASKKSPEPSHVTASAIAFGRKVDGVPVVGPGSKIVLTFGNDRSLQAVEVDWPRLSRTTTSQNLLNASEIWSRAGALSSGQVASGDAKVRSMQCGYFDAGARHRSDSPMQAGCVIRHLSAQPGDPTASGLITIVPAGRAVVADSKWPEAQRVCEASGSCAPSGAPTPSRVGADRP